MASGPPILTGDQSTFEGGTLGGWGGSSLTVANSTAIAHSGTHSLAGTGSANASGILYTGLLAGIISNATYLFTTWISPGSTLRTVTPSIYFYDSGSNNLAVSNGTPVAEGAAGTWVQASVTSSISPPGTALMRGVLNITVAVGEVHYVDDALINLTGVTPTYLQWRTGSAPGLEPSTSKQERMLRALASYVTNTNPDGTIRGS